MKNKLIFVGMTLATFIILPFFAYAQGQEQILDYHSNIEVHQDASMTVTERIKVVSTGDQIRRGIYRDFPIAYSDSNGHRYFVGFEIEKVTRNGEDEPYHTERSGNGIRLYIGEEDVFIPVGEHEYAIEYKTNRQLGFFENHDELYWNVTGNGWAFSINHASARVTLPQAVNQQDFQIQVYTGVQGSTAQNANTKVMSDQIVDFETTQPLEINEGLTIVVGFPKGIVAPPTPAQSFWATVWANLDYIIGTIGLILVALYYIYIWNKKGRDPKRGTVIAQYEPPYGYSPAFLSYVKHMGSAKDALAAGLINLGVKGKLAVVEKQKKSLFKNASYSLNKKSDSANAGLSEEEQILFDEFFKDQDSYDLEKSSAVTTLDIKNKFNAALKKMESKKYFIKNTGALIGGILLSVLTLLTVGVAAGAVRYSVDSVWEILFWPILIIGMIALNIIFGIILKSYTIAGRKLMDEIEGFKLFLSVTEKDRLSFHNPPEQTPALFEKFLPYALALGVQHKWAEQFSSLFSKLNQQGVQYKPGWYSGSLHNFTATSFASEIGDNFSGAVVSSSTPPGSSSGSSGGSSGGGGGGGGGGGW